MFGKTRRYLSTLITTNITRKGEDQLSTSDIVNEAIRSRRSVRGFLPQPVDPNILREIMISASMSPSGSNIQPWKAHVVTGEKLEQLRHLLSTAFLGNQPESREYQYYPVDWRSPYIDRRRENGWGLYETLGIKKGDKEAMTKQHARNFLFFDAPVVMFFTIDDDLEKGSWLDYGMFLQSVMVAARGYGLHTCAQAALANYPDIVKRQLGIPESEVIVCGISLGYEDPTEKANAFRATRLPIEAFVQFHS